MIALIDTDLIAYRCAASLKEGDAPETGCVRADRLMDEILVACETDEYISILSGSANWRKDFYPQYKANRTRPPPESLQLVREFMITHWDTTVTDGWEADDQIGIEMSPNTICVSIDKDLKMLAGKHYNFVKQEFQDVDVIEARRNFYKQLLLGDRSDNIPGYDGMARQKPTRIIQQWYDEIDATESEIEMFQVIAHAYNYNKDAILLSGVLLHIWRKEDDRWTLTPEMESLLESSPRMVA